MNRNLRNRLYLLMTVYIRANCVCYAKRRRKENWQKLFKHIFILKNQGNVLLCCCFARWRCRLDSSFHPLHVTVINLTEALIDTIPHRHAYCKQLCFEKKNTIKTMLLLSFICFQNKNTCQKDQDLQTGGGGAHAAFGYKCRQHRQKLKVPCSSIDHTSLN